MHDFDIVADGALKDYPLYDKIVEYKIDGYRIQTFKKRFKWSLELNIVLNIFQVYGEIRFQKLLASLCRRPIPQLLLFK